MNEANQNPTEIQRLRNVLRQITNLAKDASLTGCLEKGSRSSARQYNRILQVLQEKGIDMAGLFEPLSEDVGFEEIGVAAAQLAGYIEGETQHGTPPAPPVPPAAPAPPQPPTSGFDFSNFGFDKGAFKELDQLKGLGQMIREQLPEWIKQEVASKMAEAHNSQGVSASGSDTSTEERSDMESKHATRRLEEERAAGPGSNFCDMNMSGARFSDTNLAESAFSDVNFARVEFTDVNFGDVVFIDCNMAGARFSDACFSGASFSDVDFSNTSFTETRFSNVELNDCDVSGMKINGIAVEELLRNHRAL